MKKLSIIVLSILFLLPLLTSCKGSDKAEDFTVVCSIFPYYDLTRSVAGDGVDVVLLEKNGTDMHSYEPTISDIATLSKADVFIYGGGPSDQWIGSTLKAAKNDDLISVALVESVKTYNEEIKEGMTVTEPEEEEEIDEHIWLSLKNAVRIVETIRNTLCGAYPALSEQFNKNADALMKKLGDLDAQYEECVRNAAQKTIVFADRFPFRYLVEDYGLSYYAAFPGCSTESNASIATMQALIKAVTDNGLPAVLMIDGSDGKIAETVANNTGVKVLTLNSCQSYNKFYEKNSISYYDIMLQNLAVLTEALA